MLYPYAGLLTFVKPNQIWIVITSFDRFNINRSSVKNGNCKKNRKLVITIQILFKLRRLKKIVCVYLNNSC